MNTQEVANQYVAWCRAGRNNEVLENMYADEIVSKEMPNWPGQVVTEGIKAVAQKNEEWYANLQEMHSAEISEPLVADNHFTVKMAFDCTFKDRGRQKMEELATFKVENGKIPEEQFFYNM